MVDDDAAGPVDWSAAARVAGRLAPPGPTADRAELTALVAELRDAAARAGAPVLDTTGMRPVDGRPAEQLARVLVVDRPRWALANTQVFASLLGPLSRHADGSPVVVPAAARQAAAAQVGGVLALLAGKVLGQFDPFTGPEGRLLLVAPNVLAVETAMGVEPADFRLWVCLHELTHALQFAAAPWLADHLRSRAQELLGDLAPGTGRLEAQELLEAIGRALAGGRGGGVLGLLTPAQRAVFDEVGAVMALLEGHADVTMDEVGPAVVPTVGRIRTAFEARRDASASAGGLERLLRRLLGMDLKLAQYREGAAFVRGVRVRVGTEGFNAVWTSADTLPTAAEIADPAAWVARVRP
ncbi:zinc-dependent metalloprotease [Cellulomonas sp. NTE-D12]|uniref:zinc-dependent metalloprotease n=1 Tax=Cellulomonas sp. NTE-D12 TaxID=2962632 RepID=UPI003081C7A8|nr:hypothetical protein CELD12_29900 [Cellulomonas sp. NTE-D12]